MFLRYEKKGRTSTRRNGLFVLDDHAIPYEVHPSARARRVSLSIRSSREVRVIVPRRFEGEPVEPILREHGAWILRTLDRLRRHESALKSGFELPMLGDPRRLRIEQAEKSRGKVLVTAEEVVVWCPRGESDPRKLLTAWGVRWAKKELPRRTAELAHLHRLEFRSVTIRNQKTRWGSCTRKGGISLNWRLILFPPDVADYLICHELAHLVHHNHSRRFWGEVDRMFPAWREAERWLKTKGRALPI